MRKYPHDVLNIDFWFGESDPLSFLDKVANGADGAGRDADALEGRLSHKPPGGDRRQSR